MLDNNKILLDKCGITTYTCGITTKEVRLMSEKEFVFAETLKKALSTLPEEKKEYLLGVADGMAVMAERQKPEKPDDAGQNAS